jgi:hypothetical protein
MAVGAVVARILTQYSDKGSKAAQKDIQKLGNQFDAFGKNAVRAFGIAGAAVGAFAIKLGKDAVQGAMKDQKAQASLALALRNTTNANEAVIASTVKYLDKLELSTGVNNDELIPSLQKLVTVTGDLNTAQRLQQIALDVSAGTTKELSAVTDTFVKALNGNLGAFKRLGVSIDATIIKNNDLAAAFEQLSKTYGGQAATRAETFEFRMLRLQWAFDQALDSLGYAFLPVLEQFVDTLNREVLPQIAKWIELNKRGLAEGLRSAADAALQLLKAAIAIGQWIVTNFETVKNMALLFATMWATAKVYAFVSAIGKVTLAFRGMQAAAAGAAVAGAAATGAGGAAGGAAMAARLATLGAGGATLGWAALIAAPIAAAGYAVKKAGNSVRERRAKLEAGLAGYKGAPGPSDLASLGAKTSTVKDPMQEYLDYLKKLQALQNKFNNAKKKELTTEQKIINAMLQKYGLTLMTSEIEAKATAAAIKENQERQLKIASSPTVSLASQSDGSASGNVISGSSGNTLIAIKLETPVGADLEYIAKVDDGRRLLSRRGSGGGQFVAQVE